MQAVPVQCGTLAVPENRDTGSGRTIKLRVVVVPARRKPAPRTAAALEQYRSVVRILP